MKSQQENHSVTSSENTESNSPLSPIKSPNKAFLDIKRNSREPEQIPSNRGSMLCKARDLKDFNEIYEKARSKLTERRSKLMIETKRASKIRKKSKIQTSSFIKN